VKVPCLTEFKYAVYADGELPEDETRLVTDHLTECMTCSRLVESLQIERQMLLDCLQNTHLIEFELEDETLTAPQAANLTITKFAAFVLAMAVLLRPVLTMVGELEFPRTVDWLNPLSSSFRMDLLAATLIYVLPALTDSFYSLLNNATWIAFSAAVILAVVLCYRKSVWTNAGLSLLALLTVFSSSTYALDTRAGDKPVTVPAGETIDDTLIVAGDSVIVDGTVAGDLIAFVRQVRIRGTVKGNVISFARRVDLEGTVEGSVIGFAQSLENRGKVAHNLYGFAQTLDVAQSGDIAENATIFAAETDIAGAIAKDVVAFTSSVNVLSSARIGGNFTARAGQADKVRIDSKESIAGRTTIRTPMPQPSKYSTASFYVWQTIWLAAAFVTGLVLFWLFPSLSQANLANSRDLLLSAGVGFLSLIAPPIAGIVAAITLVGLPLGLLTLTLWIVASYLAKIVIAAFVGRSLLASAGDRTPALAPILLVGLVPIFVAINLPYVGGLINFLLVVLGLGTLVTNSYRGSRWGQTAAQAA